MPQTFSPKFELLLPEARRGEEHALGEILEASRRYLLWVARRQMDSSLLSKAGPSDLVQLTFLEAHADFAKFNGDSEEELTAWLRRLLLNNISNFARHYRDTSKRNVNKEVKLNELAPPVRASKSLERVSERDEVEHLWRMVDRLSGDQRRVVKLWYEGLTFEEIGDAILRTPNASRMLWSRAIEKLRELAIGDLENAR